MPKTHIKVKLAKTYRPFLEKTFPISVNIPNIHPAQPPTQVPPSRHALSTTAPNTSPSNPTRSLWLHLLHRLHLSSTGLLAAWTQILTRLAHLPRSDGSSDASPCWHLSSSSHLQCHYLISRAYFLFVSWECHLHKAGTVPHLVCCSVSSIWHTRVS